MTTVETQEMADDVRQFERSNVNIMTVVLFSAGCVSVAGALFAKPSTDEVKEIASTVVTAEKNADEKNRTELLTRVGNLETMQRQSFAEQERFRKEQEKTAENVHSLLLLAAEQRGAASLRKVKSNIAAGRPPTKGVINE